MREKQPIQFRLRLCEQRPAGVLGCEVDAYVEAPAADEYPAQPLFDIRRGLYLPTVRLPITGFCAGRTAQENRLHTDRRRFASCPLPPQRGVD